MTRLTVNIDGSDYQVEITAHASAPNELVAVVDGEEVPVVLPHLEADKQLDWLVVGTRSYELLVDRDLRWLQSWDGRHTVEVRDLDATVTRPVSGDGRIKAPIPGLITDILVEPGQQVEVGQPLLVLEAMKMENEIQAPRPGKVQEVVVSPGSTVELNELMIEIA